MRQVPSLVVLVSAGLVATSCAYLTPASNIAVSANAWDTRTEGYGCKPSGCIAGNVLDDSIEADSRWSCRGKLFASDSDDEGDTCKLTFVFDAPQDVQEMRMALWKGDRRIRSVNVWVDGHLVTTLESSGETEGYEDYTLIAMQVTSIVLEYDGPRQDWISITEVQFMVDSELEPTSPSPIQTVPAPTPSPSQEAPTVTSTRSPESVSYTGWKELGCYQDNERDRLMPDEFSFSGMYRQKCFDICKGENPDYTHFGLEDYFQCWCGFATDEKEGFESLKLDISECNEECATGGELCGGVLKMRVFEVVQIDGVNPRVGCFYDRSPPAMNATPVLDSPDMTRED